MTQYTTKFIVDIYNKYDSTDRATARHIFYFHNQAWAIKEYAYENGQLMRPVGILERDDVNEQFKLYDSYDEAMRFVVKIKGKVGENE